ncbi:MAG TPA: hypothetical protein PKH15_07950 [Bacteroidales bacterium]|nr:hypothetical protein [Bacteroidales bacterium]
MSIKKYGDGFILENIGYKCECGCSSFSVILDNLYCFACCKLVHELDEFERSHLHYNLNIFRKMNLIECENKKSISNNTNSNNTKLYHRKLKWHDCFDKQSFEIIKNVQEISCHAYNHIIDKKQKRYNIHLGKMWDIIENITLENCKPFEVEYDGNLEQVTKCVLRLNYDFKRDISIVFRDRVIIACWLNSKDDLHDTLDESKYEK